MTKYFNNQITAQTNNTIHDECVSIEIATLSVFEE